MTLQPALQPAAVNAPNVAAAPEPSGRNGGATSAATAAHRSVLGTKGDDDRAVVAGQGRLVADPDELAHIAESLRPLAVPIDALRPMPGNARAHGERDLLAIAASLQGHGQQRPVVAARRYRSVEGAIVAGCGTWTAARRLGWRFIAASWFIGSEQEAAAYSVRDNRTAELSAWSPDALGALRADGVDLASLWHDDAGLDALLGAAVSEADWCNAFSNLPNEDRAPIQQITFTVSDRQAEIVRRALTAAKALGRFEDDDNQSTNGNALARIAVAFLAAHGEASS